jgi:hypothetical protein
MPLRVTRPRIDRYELKDLDPDGETFVEIKQATQAAVERRAAATESRTHIMGSGRDAIKVVSKFNYPEVQRYEAYLTMVGCNIEHPDGGPLFKFKQTSAQLPYLDMGEEEFEKAWGILPEEWASAIHERILDTNPMWSFQDDDDEPDF